MQKTIKRILSIFLTVIMVFTTFFIFDPSVLKIESEAAVSVEGVSSTYFYVPETIYLAPSSTSFKYAVGNSYSFDASSKVLSSTVLKGYGNISTTDVNHNKVAFYYANASSVTIKQSGASSLTLGGTNISSSNGKSISYTASSGYASAVISAGTMSSYASNWITWTATYVDTKDNTTKSITAKTYVYAPFVSAVAGFAANRTKRGSIGPRYRSSTAGAAIFGIHTVENSHIDNLRILNPTNISSYDTYEPNGDDENYNSGVFSKKLNTYSSAPGTWFGVEGGDIANILNPKDSSYNTASKSGTSTCHESSGHDDATCNGGKGIVYIDTSRINLVEHVPNLHFNAYDLNKTSNVEDYRRAAAVMVGNDSVFDNTNSSSGLTGSQIMTSTSHRTSEAFYITNGDSSARSWSISDGKSIVIATYVQQSTGGSTHNSRASARVTFSGADKSAARNALNYAIQNSGMINSLSLSSTDTLMKNYNTALDNVYNYLRVGYSVSTADGNTYATALTNAVNAIKNKSYTATQHNVRVYLNGSNYVTVSNEDKSKTYNAGATVTYTPESYSGYTFKGYKQNGSYSGTFAKPSSFDGSSNPFVISNVSSDLAYSYYYEPTDYQISYNLNGGSASGNPTSYNIFTSPVKLNNPTKDGYSFLGWTGSNGSTPQTTVYTPNVVGIGLSDYSASSPLTANGRDHIKGNTFAVSPGQTYRVFVTAKRTAGSLPLQGGIWYTSSSEPYTGYGGAFTYLRDAGNGYGVYYKDITVPSGKTDGQFYIQLDQNSSTGYSTTWLIYDGFVVSTNSLGNLSYTANWGTRPTINRATAVQDGTSGFWIYANVTAGTAGLNRVAFPTWTNYKTNNNEQDDIQSNWSQNALGESGSWPIDGSTYNYRYYVDINAQGVSTTHLASDGYNTQSKYYTHVYAYDNYGGDVSYGVNMPYADNDGYFFRFTLTLDANGGSLSSNNSSYTQKPGTTVTVNNPTRTGYTFSSWSKSGGGSLSGTTYTFGSTASTVGDCTLTANWTAHTYKIAYYDGNTNLNYTQTNVTYNKEEGNITSSVPSKTGYTFKGWATTTGQTNGTYSKGQKITAQISKDLYPDSNGGTRILYAAWSATSYTISYTLNGGTVSPANPTSYTIESAAITLRNPTRTGYDFKGWSGTGLSGDGNKTVTIAAGSTGNREYTANWTEKSATLTYKNGGHGTAPDAVTMKYTTATTAAAAISTVVGTGYTYTFKNWSGSDGNTYNPGDTVKAANVVPAALTLTATWTTTTHTYTLSYNPSGGTSGSTTSSSLTYNTAFEIPKTAKPTKTGYTLQGWTATNGGTTATYTHTGDKCSLTAENVNTLYPGSNNGTRTLYAVWSANTYTVKFNGNGNTNTSVTMDNMSFNYDEEKALTANAFEKKYTVGYNANGGSVTTTAENTASVYTFSGWATSTDGAVAYTNQQKVKNLTETNNGTVNLYAKWTLGSVTLPTPSRTGYTFGGWYNVSTKAGNAGESYTPEANVTLTAKWTANTFTLAYNANGGTNAPASQTLTYDTEDSITSLTPSRDGYTFKGWATTSSGAAAYSSGAALDKAAIASLYSIRNTSNNTVTLYAVWEARTDTVYKVKVFEMKNDGTYPASATRTVELTGKTDTTATITSSTTGLYTNNQFTLDEGNSNNVLSGVIKGNGSLVLTVYAKRAQHTVTYYRNYSSSDTTEITSETKYYQAAVDLSKTAERSGYKFLGWNTSSTATAAISSLSMGTADIKLYAVWELNEFTITFDDAGGTGGPGTKKATYNSAMPALNSNEIPTYSGFNFAGYYTGENGNGTQHYNADGTSANKWTTASGGKLFAKWICPVLKDVNYDKGNSQWIYTYETDNGGTTTTSSKTPFTNAEDITKNAPSDAKQVVSTVTTVVDTHANKEMADVSKIDLNKYSAEALDTMVNQVNILNDVSNTKALKQTQLNEYVLKLAEREDTDYSANIKPDTKAPNVKVYDTKPSVNGLNSTILTAADSTIGKGYRAVDPSNGSGNYTYAGKWANLEPDGVDYYIYTNSTQPVIAIELDDGEVATSASAANRSSYPTSVVMENDKIADIQTTSSAITAGYETSATKAINNKKNAWFSTYLSAGVGSASGIDYNAKGVIYLKPDFTGVSGSATNNEAVYTITPTDDALTPNEGMQSANLASNGVGTSYETRGEASEIKIAICYHNSMNAGTDVGGNPGDNYLQAYTDQVNVDTWLNQMHLFRTAGGVSNWELPSIGDKVYKVVDQTYPGLELGSFGFLFKPADIGAASFSSISDAKTKVLNYIKNNASTIQTGITNSSADNHYTQQKGLGLFTLNTWSTNFYPQDTETYLYCHLIDRWGNVFNKVWKCDHIDTKATAIQFNNVDEYDIFEDGGSNIADIDLNSTEFEFILDETSNMSNGVFSTTGGSFSIKTSEPNKTYNITIKDNATNETKATVTTDADGILTFNVEDACMNLEGGAYKFNLNGKEVNLYAGAVVLSASGGTSYVGEPAEIKVTTVSGITKVQLVRDGKTITFTRTSAEVKENEDGTLEWTMNVNNLAAGEYRYTINAKAGKTWYETAVAANVEKVIKAPETPTAIIEAQNAEVTDGERATIKVKTIASTEKVQLQYGNLTITKTAAAENEDGTMSWEISAWKLPIGENEIIVRAKYDGKWQAEKTVKVTVTEKANAIKRVNAAETVKRGETTTIEVVTSVDTIKVQFKLSAVSTKTYTVYGTETVDNGDGTMTWKIERAFANVGENEIVLAAKDSRGWSDYETYATVTVTK